MGDRDLLAGKTVLEVGAGLGVCGLVAAKFAKRTIITECNTECLVAVQHNIELNKEGEEQAH